MRLSRAGASFCTRHVLPSPLLIARRMCAPTPPVTPTLYERVSGFVRARPLRVAMTCTTLKTIAADLTVQTVIEQRREVDTRRTLTFGIFGCLWMGGAQYYIYAVWLERLIVPGSAAASALLRVLVDQFVYVPALFLPIFYTVDSLVKRDAHLHVIN